MEKNEKKLCKKCKEEINKDAKICPHCRKKQGMPIWLIVLIVILAVGILGTIFGSESNNDSSNNDEQKTQTTKKKENLQLEEGHTGSLDDYGVAYYIEGYVKNNSDKEYSYVQIEFTTYDSEGNTLGTCLDNNSGLDANGRWKFKAMCVEQTENIASYKLKEITGY